MKVYRECLEMSKIEEWIDGLKAEEVVANSEHRRKPKGMQEHGL